MPRNLRTKQKSDTSVKITIIVAIIGLMGTLGAAYLNSRATLETKKQEIALVNTQLAIQANSTNAALTLVTHPTNTSVPTATATSLQEVTPNSTSEIFFEDFSSGSQYWELGTKDSDSNTSSLSIFNNNALRWEVIAKKRVVAYMGYPNLPVTSNIDMEVTLNFKDGSEGVEYGLAFRRTNSGSYNFMVNRKGMFYLGKYNGQDREYTYLTDWMSPSIPIHLNNENKLRVHAVENNIRVYINNNLVGDFVDSAFSSGIIDIIAYLEEGEKLTLDISDFKLTLVSP